MGSEIRLIKDSIFEEIQDTLEGIRPGDKPITRIFDIKSVADNFCNLFTILGQSCEVQEVEGVLMLDFGTYPYLKYVLKIMVTDGKDNSNGRIKRLDRQHKKKKVYDRPGVLL